MPVQLLSRWSTALAVALVGCALLATPARAQTPGDVGQWSSVMSWPISATHAQPAARRQGDVLRRVRRGGCPPRRWDPVTNTLSALPGAAGYNIFCAGHSYLADGRLLVTGGHVECHVGLNDASLFDPFTATWTRLPDMNAGRWYPTNTTLANGDVMVLSGEINGSGVHQRRSRSATSRPRGPGGR